MNTRLCGNNNITNKQKKKYIYIKKKCRIIEKKINKNNINVRPELNEKLMAANVYINSLMSKSFV